MKKLKKSLIITLIAVMILNIFSCQDKNISVDEENTDNITKEGTNAITIDIITEGTDTTVIPDIDIIIPVERSETKLAGFLRTNGAKFIDDSGEIILKGISFGNAVSGAAAMPTYKYNENQYEELSGIGFNSFRFYLSYSFFEDNDNPFIYKQTGWDWLDRHVNWARKYNTRLILSMMVAPGGNHRDIFTNPANQERAVALWTAIAERYKDEIAIGGYDILNEPIYPTGSGEYPTQDQLDEAFEAWRSLAQRITDGIRSVDENHIIIVERLYDIDGVGDADGRNDFSVYNLNGAYNFVPINDPCDNYAYTYHCYQPGVFVHQGVGGAAGPLHEADGFYYQYPSAAVALTGTGKIGGNNIGKGEILSNNPETDYATVTSKMIRPEDAPKTKNKDLLNIGKAAIKFENLPDGATIWVKNIAVKEYDENQNYIRTLTNHSFEIDATNGYGQGWGGLTLSYDSSEKAMKIPGTISDGGTTYNHDDFILKPGHYYQITADIKGENIGKAEVYPMLSFDYSEGAMGMDKDLLEFTIPYPLDYIRNIAGVPAYLGEYGVYCDNVELRGGDKLLEDTFDIFDKYGISSNFHPYWENEVVGDSTGQINPYLEEAFRKAFEK
ncbi:MAG: glycoside hydrolase family 5 protein [Oscillospiraceae bacterium]|nr:glycoside hydrolase family 5 protein [Oscillospiraceae bacterium]